MSLTNPQTQGQLVAATLENMSNDAIDNITNNNALFYKMRQNGSFKAESGGKLFREKLLYATNTNTQWQDAYATFNTDAQNFLTYADFNIKTITSSIGFFDKDITENSGKEQLIDLITAGVQSTIITLTNDLSESLYSDGSNSAEIEGLQLLISKTPTSGVVGGIDRADYEFWRNQVYDFSTETVTPSSTTIQQAMNALYLRCLVQGATSAPDTVVADAIYWDYFRASLTDIQRVTNAKMAEAGFDVIKFKNMDVSYDPNCPASTMYFLNSKHLKLKYLSVKNSEGTKGSVKSGGKALPSMFTAAPPTRPINQFATNHPFLGMMNLTIDNARTSGVICA
jgi:hypothetical protein